MKLICHEEDYVILKKSEMKSLIFSAVCLRRWIEEFEEMADKGHVRAAVSCCRYAFERLRDIKNVAEDGYGRSMWYLDYWRDNLSKMKKYYLEHKDQVEES